MPISVKVAAVLMVAAIAACSTPSAKPIVPLAGRSPEDRFVDSVLSGLTLQEKLGQLTQDGYPPTKEQAKADIRAGRVGSYLGVAGAALTRELQQVAVEQSRAKIPLLFAHDVIHGFGTIFPVPIAEASSWDPQTVMKSARVSAIEGAAHGLHWTFAPMVDIARDPRWGRIVEGAGEDPYLGSVMAAARVIGFQGRFISDTLSLIATAKHFVAYGAAEGGRDYNVASVPPRVLNEIYLPPFRAAVNAGARSVMGSFNEVDGVPMHANSALINGTLRKKWGWDGMLVSDYTAIMELMRHGIAADSGEAARRGIDAGVDIDMVSRFYLDHLAAQVNEGKVPIGQIDAAVKRVLRAKYEKGLFTNPYIYSSVEREKRETLSPAHREAARDVARKAIVLLRNENNTLPLKKTLRTIAVIGPLANDARSALGPWAAEGKPASAITPLDGIRSALPNTRVVYVRGVPVDTVNQTGIAEAARVAGESDAVVLIVGERSDMSAEAESRSSIELPGNQLELVQAVWNAVKESGKPVVVVLANGRPLAVPWIASNIPAIVETWFLGTATGDALADVLFGDFNPGGKLPVTFPRATGQIPLYYNHRNTGRPPIVEDKYRSKYNDIPWTPQFVFGFGLSYTTFSISNPVLSASEISASDSIVVRAAVTNTGSRAGDEVVQLYLRDDAASVTQPVKSLKGFERVSLAAGETRDVSFVLRPRDFALYDLDMRLVVEPGTFTVWVGNSSESGGSVSFRIGGAVTEITERGLLPPPYYDNLRSILSRLR